MYLRTIAKCCERQPTPLTHRWCEPDTVIQENIRRIPRDPEGHPAMRIVVQLLAAARCLPGPQATLQCHASHVASS